MTEEEFDDFIDEVEEWANKKDPDTVNKWEEYARKYMENWEWNDKSISDFIKWGKYGFNNKLLRKYNSFESFYNEVEYSSDRMSIDRLFRCHVKYITLFKGEMI